MTLWLPPLLTALAAYLLTLALTPWAIRLAPLIGAVDVPRDARRLHRHPTPRTGGLAMFISLLLCASVTGVALPLLWGATLITLLGVFDDIFRLPALLKLIVQLIAAAVTLGNGIGTLPAGLSTPSALLIGILWLVLLINAHNMIDGLDGLAASVAAIESLALSIALAIGGNIPAATLALILFGCSLGFLYFNRHPARIFMGDTGSQLLGLILGWVSLHLVPSNEATLTLLAPPLIFSLPLSDLGFAVLRRTLRGQNPFTADRGHWHHRLMDAGLGQRRSCRWLCILCSLPALAGVTLVSPNGEPYAVYALLGTVSVLILLKARCQKLRTGPVSE